MAVSKITWRGDGEERGEERGEEGGEGERERERGSEYYFTSLKMVVVVKWAATIW